MPPPNRDPRAFDDPERLDVTRPNNRHVAFGFGSHFCLGAALARLEIRVMFEELLARIPDWELVAPDEPQIMPATFAAGVRPHPHSIHPELTGSRCASPTLSRRSGRGSRRSSPARETWRSKASTVRHSGIRRRRCCSRWSGRPTPASSAVTSCCACDPSRRASSSRTTCTASSRSSGRSNERRSPRPGSSGRNRPARCSAASST